MREKLDKAWDFHVNAADLELKASWLTRWQQLHNDLQAMDNGIAALEAKLPISGLHNLPPAHICTVSTTKPFRMIRAVHTLPCLYP